LGLFCPMGHIAVAQVDIHQRSQYWFAVLFEQVFLTFRTDKIVEQPFSSILPFRSFGQLLLYQTIVLPRQLWMTFAQSILLIAYQLFFKLIRLMLINIITRAILRRIDLDRSRTWRLIRLGILLLYSFLTDFHFLRF
jgi:hypothetical protein